MPLTSLVDMSEFADSATLNRYNRVRAITVSATLQPGVSLGDALDKMEAIARKALPPEAKLDYKGQSLDYKRSGESIMFVFDWVLKRKLSHVRTMKAAVATAKPTSTVQPRRTRRTGRSISPIANG